MCAEGHQRLVLRRCPAMLARAVVLALGQRGREDRAVVPLRSWGFRGVGSSPNLALRGEEDGVCAHDFVLTAALE